MSIISVKVYEKFRLCFCLFLAVSILHLLTLSHCHTCINTFTYGQASTHIHLQNLLLPRDAVEEDGARYAAAAACAEDSAAAVVGGEGGGDEPAGQRGPAKQGRYVFHPPVAHTGALAHSRDHKGLQEGAHSAPFHSSGYNL